MYSSTGRMKETLAPPVRQNEVNIMCKFDTKTAALLYTNEKESYFNSAMSDASFNIIENDVVFVPRSPENQRSVGPYMNILASINGFDGDFSTTPGIGANSLKALEADLLGAGPGVDAKFVESVVRDMAEAMVRPVGISSNTRLYSESDVRAPITVQIEGMSYTRAYYPTEAGRYLRARLLTNSEHKEIGRDVQAQHDIPTDKRVMVLAPVNEVSIVESVRNRMQLYIDHFHVYALGFGQFNRTMRARVAVCEALARKALFDFCMGVREYNALADAFANAAPQRIAHPAVGDVDAGNFVAHETAAALGVIENTPLQAPGAGFPNTFNTHRANQAVTRVWQEYRKRVLRMLFWTPSGTDTERKRSMFGHKFYMNAGAEVDDDSPYLRDVAYPGRGGAVDYRQLTIDSNSNGGRLLRYQTNAFTHSMVSIMQILLDESQNVVGRAVTGNLPGGQVNLYLNMTGMGVPLLG